LARDTSGAAFRTFGELLTAWLARMIRANSLAESGGGILPGEEALMRGLMERRGLAPWLALWEKLVRTFAQTEAVSLDRKQVLIASFLEMQSLAGTAAGKRA
jgi:DNA polymerase-3 subunit delta'